MHSDTDVSMSIYILYRKEKSPIESNLISKLGLSFALRYDISEETITETTNIYIDGKFNTK